MTKQIISKQVLLDSNYIEYSNNRFCRKLNDEYGNEKYIIFIQYFEANIVQWSASCGFQNYKSLNTTICFEVLQWLDESKYTLEKIEQLVHHDWIKYGTFPHKITFIPHVQALCWWNKLSTKEKKCFTLRLPELENKQIHQIDDNEIQTLFDLNNSKHLI